MHPNEEFLNAYADGSIDASDRADVERHLASCPSCRQIVDDVREILRASGALERREPPVRAWSRIERAIRLEREHATPISASGARGFRPSGSGADDARLKGSRSVGSGSSRPRSRVLLWLAAAAVLVLATVVGIRYVPSRGGGGAGPPGSRAAGTTIAAGDAAQSVETELREAEAHYENAIKGLEQIANAEQNALDPRTAATLQKNLAVIDQAISESRAAVRSQPSSEPAQQSLAENFKAKIGLLQDTVALINEMRKGNEAGAARIVSGLKGKGD
jgi:anti-sigma factor ChrR (cupin superfamily)